MFTQRPDKIVKSTDLDALSCRFNCIEKGYIKDEAVNKIIESYLKHLRFCDGYTNLSAGRAYRSIFDKKLPIINRGTYLRTQSISLIIEKFIQHHQRCQIVSMGGGSDTRMFKVLKDNVNYIEIDFPETTRIKKLAIINDEPLSKALGCPYTPRIVESRQEFEQVDANLHGSNYHLIGMDLRQLCAGNDDDLKPYVDYEIPTLVLSECVLCYLNPSENESILKYWRSRVSKLSVLIYEPISLNDLFGLTMVENLSKRGINLLTINEFPTLQSKLEFMKKVGFSTVRITDLSRIGGFNNQNGWFNDQQGIKNLEFIDEIEEIRLLLMHYCLIYSSIDDLGLDLGLQWDITE